MSAMLFFGALFGAIITSKVSGALFSLDKLQAQAAANAGLDADDLEVDA